MMYRTPQSLFRLFSDESSTPTITPRTFPSSFSRFPTWHLTFGIRHLKFAFPVGERCFASSGAMPASDDRAANLRISVI